MRRIATIALRNFFFVIGFLALVLMVWKIGFDTIVDNIVKTGWWFAVIIGMWLPIYIINTIAFNTIVRDDDPNNHTLSFLKLFKINISGFALKAATPLGFLGGDPYKIVELKNAFGVEKATSSVVLYSMTHISAHFLFWAFSIVIAALFIPMPLKYSVLLLLIFLVFLLVLFMLWKGYRKGLTKKVFDFLSKVPLIKKWCIPFCERNLERFIQIDSQISCLYNKRKKAFLTSMGLEIFARFCNCLEVYVILKSVHVDISIFQSIVIYAFMTLFTNILFFSPMQIGTREGGFLLAFKALSLSGGLGIYVSLVTRVREMIWIGIGVLLMKIKTQYQLPEIVHKSKDKLS